MRLFFIINSLYRRSKSDRLKLQYRFGSTHEYRLTESTGHATDLARQAVDDGYTHIIAVGGDGTINEVVNGILSSSVFDASKPMFTFLPRGSGNDLARTLGYDESIDSLDQRIQRSNGMAMDVGFARFDKSARYFMNVMDLGLGGSVAREVQKYRRGPLSFLAYQRAIWKILPFYTKRRIKVSSKEFNYAGKALSIVIANARWFGAGLGIAPEAQINDGKLDVVIIGNVGVLEYLRYIPSLLQGRKIFHADVHYIITEEIEINGELLCSEIDGEPSDEAPVTIAIATQKICILI
jgi:YegS/Rv2252/BmrU family lipid kinase